MGKEKKKVLVGMSGGVDSSVAAALLLEQGYEVIGAFMKNWSKSENPDLNLNECDWTTERRDAMRVAAQLDIPFMTFDFEKEYREKVVENMFEEFAAGRTPNPDVLCNKYIKFDLFLREADRLGCDYLATGHYARTDGGRILKGIDSNKDQTYFLWAIPPEVIPRVLFPVGDMEKSEVREKAQELDLDVADKKDSTGICFVGEVDIREFIKQRIPEDPGDIVSVDGKVLGQHPGVHFFTIGQRRGIDIGGGTPYYVVEKRPETKQLVVSSNFHPALFNQDLTAHSLNWFHKPDQIPHDCHAQIRYRQESQPCTITKIVNDLIEVSFKENQRAVTSGQSIVFYDGEEMIGGGIIE